MSLFPVLRGNEYYRTVGFKEIAYIFGDTQISFRKTADGINRFRYQQENGTPHRTLHEGTEREGAGIIKYLDRTSDCLLRQNEFSEDGLYEGIKAEHFSKNEPICLMEEEIAEAANLCCCPAGYTEDDLLSNPVIFENQAYSVDISIDDVVVKKQEEARIGNNPLNQGLAHI